MLIAERITKRYGPVSALNGFDLRVEPGEIVGLVGHNGAGKTTFVEIVSGLVRPDSGRIFVAGVDALNEPRRARGLLGVAPQEQALYPSATVREHFALFGALAGLRRGALCAAIDRVAEELLLVDVLERPTGLLSGGQRKRAQAGCALLAAPPVLLLDEPTVGADPATRAALLAAVRGRAAAGAAIVYTTHYLPELAELRASLAVAQAGRVIARGSQTELLAGLPGEVRLRFANGVPAELRALGRVVGDRLCVASHDPATTLAELLANGHVPDSVDIDRPGIDDLYAALAVEARDAA